MALSIANNHNHIHTKLDYFIASKKIPNIIFHGASGSGKRTILNTFLEKIYENDREKMKKHIMCVECSHGKGIKFIREDLKFFAKSHIQSNHGANFKSIVLLNADSLTIDAQSALRRCIELFSHNTRFFIAVENKERLLNPILSRFCEIYVSPYIDQRAKCLRTGQTSFAEDIGKRMDVIIPIGWELYNNICQKYITNKDAEFSAIQELIHDSTMWCECGYSALQWIECVKYHAQIGDSPNKCMIIMCYHKIKPDFRSEKLLVYYVMYFTLISSNEDLENILVF